MGWRGALRSFAAAARAAERDAQRQHKAALQRQIADDAAAAVAEWEDYVENLVGVHARLGDVIDWASMAGEPKPSQPLLQRQAQEAAELALSQFKPGLFDFLSGGSAKRRAKLERALDEAPARDEAALSGAHDDYRAKLADWETDTGLARRLLAGEGKAIGEVIGEMTKNLEGQSLIGTQVEFSIGDKFVHAKPFVHADSIVPQMRPKQAASGRLTQAKMPAGQFNELYQDYVASVALKVAGELFHVLPLSELYVTCLADMLDPQTGHKKHTPILSVQFVRDTYFKLNLANLDPSDAMRNFNHAMSFKKAQGFAPVQPLKPLSNDAAGA